MPVKKAVKKAVKKKAVKRGPKKKTVRWKQVATLCEMQCTQEEIAAVCGMCLDTLETRCKEKHGIKFSEFFKQKREGGKASLRRSQWLQSKKSAAMAIFLGKNYLEQTDKTESTVKHTAEDEFLDLVSRLGGKNVL
jgi:hypothetical protein